MATKEEIARLERDLKRLEKESAHAAEKRAALPPGSSRARVTSANARWARIAEARDLAMTRYQEAVRNEDGPTLTAALAAKGLGHRKADVYQPHEIFKLDGGEVVGRMHASEAWEFLRTGKAAS